MENASKALIIAATTILAVLILGSMVYLFRAGSAVGESYNERQIQNSRELYNSRFLSFNRNNNNISDIISLCNLAYDSNLSSEYNTSYAVIIDVKIKDLCHFVIPNIEIDGLNRKSILLVKKNNIQDLKVNNTTVFLENIYDLMDTCIREIPNIDLGAESNSENWESESGLQVYNNDKFSETIRSINASNNGVSYSVMSSASPDEENLVDDIMIYKYLFRCDGIEYNSEGRVSKMSFTCFNNYFETDDGRSVRPNKNNGAAGSTLKYIY